MTDATPPTAAKPGPDAVGFAELRTANVARNIEWSAGNVLSLSFRGNELAGEVGEACNVLKKLDREQMGLVGSRATKADADEELADVVICADLAAMDLGIDLGAAVVAKFDATSEKRGLSTRLGALNTPDAPTPRDLVTRPDGGEDDVAFLDRMQREDAEYGDYKDVERLITLARRGALVPTAEARPFAWAYENAHGIGSEDRVYCDWRSKLSHDKPHAPDGAIRNLTPLYTHPQAAPAATGAVDIELQLRREIIGWTEIAGKHLCRAERAEATLAVLAATPAGSTPDGGWREAPSAAEGEDGVMGLEWLFNEGLLAKLFVDFDRDLHWSVFVKFRDGQHVSFRSAPPSSVATSGDTDDAAELYEEVVDACGYHGATDAQSIARSVVDRRRTASPRACAGPVTEAGYAAARKAFDEAARQIQHQDGLIADPDGYVLGAALQAYEAARAATATPAPGQTDGGARVIYVASKTKHAGMWQRNRDCGLPIISTWIDEAGVGETSDLTDLWRRCITEASTADALVIYREPDDVLKGAWAEMGAALAHGVPVFAVGIDEFSISNAPNVRLCTTLAEALNGALEVSQKPQTDGRRGS